MTSGEGDQRTKADRDAVLCCAVLCCAVLRCAALFSLHELHEV
jgi:hypothetical protein